MQLNYITTKLSEVDSDSILRRLNVVERATPMEKLTLKHIFRYITRNYRLLARYVISGLSGVVANLVVFTAVMEWLDLWYIFAALLGFCAAYLVTFSMHKWWTFDKTAEERTIFQSILYLGSALVTLLINTALLYMFVEWLGLLPVIGQFVALGISAVLSFLFTSQITFHGNENRWRILVDVCVARYVSKWWFVPCVLVTVLILFGSARISLVPVTFPSDAEGFVATAQYIFDEPGGRFEGSRFLKPAAPVVIGVIAAVTNIEYPTAVLAQAFLGYVLLGMAAYWLGHVFWQDRKAAFAYALLISSAYPIVRYGLDNYVESGAWALYLAALASMLLWYQKPQTKWLWLTALLLLVGLLWKEYAGLAGLVFGLVILFQPVLSVRQKFWSIVQGVSLSLLPWGIWQYYIYKVYDYTYLDWLAMGASEEFYQATYTLMAVIKSSASLLLVAWLFVLLGIIRFATLSKFQRQFIYFLLIPSFGFLLWGWVSSRLFFSLVPLAALIAVHGMRSFFVFRTQLLMLLLITIMNIALAGWSLNPDVRAMLNNFAYDTTSEQSVD